MSTPMLRNFWRMLAYMTSCTPFLRSSARICWMRRKRTRPWRSLSSSETSTLLAARLLLVEFVRHAVEGCLDGGGEEVGLVVEDVSEDLTGGGAGRHGRADEAGAVGILARGTRAGVGRRSGTYREAVTAAREVAGARGEQRQ